MGAGVGSSVFPFRVGDRAQREVALFELGVAPGAIDEHHTEQPALAGRAPTAELVEKRRLAVAKKVAARSKRRTR